MAQEKNENSPVTTNSNEWTLFYGFVASALQFVTQPRGPFNSTEEAEAQAKYDAAYISTLSTELSNRVFGELRPVLSKLKEDKARVDDGPKLEIPGPISMF